ncbi:MAG TPA: 3-(methylthio)propionyl-CoA ligase [Beijerinckiaceae bacterium]|jgi:fatty-acyl-CoA synthase
MDGLMMDRPLLVSSLIAHAGTYHGDTEIVSRTVEGPIHRTTYAEAERRAKKLANALKRLGIGPGDRVGTLAWNGYRHFELYFGVSGIGAVCHTINPRLFHDQIVYIVNHAEDRLLFLDLTFVPLVEKLADKLKPIRHYVIMTDEAHMPQTSLPNVLAYETLIGPESDALDWPEFDEKSACSMCYTSGTTGNPKAALYSNRSTLLHTWAVCSADSIGFSSADTICPIVPMFHANAWGVPYAATMVGAKLVFPGAALDGPSLCELFESEGVTLTLGVPTVWLGMLKEMEARGKKPAKLERLLVGGSAAPYAMIETFEKRYGVTVMHGWGMTEMSPVGTVGTMKGKHRDLPIDEKIAIKAMQGRPMYGVEMKIVDGEGRRLPHDGVSVGELLVRGPWIVAGYYDDEKASKAAIDEEGWFRTGDVCAIDPDGYLRVTDRAKDVIKSGGEWISSIDIENAAMGHPEVAEAAVIGLPHPKWSERPLLIVVPKEGRTPTKESLLEFLSGRMAKWMLPDDVVFAEELPHTATGKLLKTRLRETYRDHRLPAD